MAPRAVFHNLQSFRSRISDEVRQLRQEHRWTQSELAKQLDLSQSRLSEIERGQGSFTAEQFLVLLRLFNVTPAHFGGEVRDRAAETQNALARHGARGLYEDVQILPGEDLDAGEAIRNALIDGHPRLVVSSAVVLVRNLERIHLKRVQTDLVDAGSPGRLPWLMESALHAAGSLLTENAAPAAWARRLRRVEAALTPFLDSLRASRGEHLVWDVLDPNIRSTQTTDEVRRLNYGVSNYWRIVTRLQLADFITALRAAARDD
jgi:transcriptional regulator with XRE-family HTH domain